MNKKLTRSIYDRKLCGVCGGLAQYLGIDATVIRLAWVVLSILGALFTGVILYVIAAVIMPEEAG